MSLHFLLSHSMNIDLKLYINNITIIIEIVNDGDWVERFIQAVQCRPPIYNTKLPEHSDRNLVLCLWSEICEAMFPMWQNLSSSEKWLRGNEITKFQLILNILKITLLHIWYLYIIILHV